LKLTSIVERDDLQNAVQLKAEAQVREATLLGLPLVLEGVQGATTSLRAQQHKKADIRVLIAQKNVLTACEFCWIHTAFLHTSAYFGISVSLVSSCRRKKYLNNYPFMYWHCHFCLN
jgi:hypothetical protein